jgi:hypothetical protein
MADVEQEKSSAAEVEHQRLPRQALQLPLYSGIEEASSVALLVRAYVDVYALTVTAKTAKDAFASAIEWHVVGKLTDVSINDGTRSYSIVEFSLIGAC